MSNILHKVQEYINPLIDKETEIQNRRKVILDQLVEYIRNKQLSYEEIRLNFICTHNSRRSQLAQIWATAASFFYDVPKVKTYSGGVEVTAFNEKAVAAIKNAGFRVAKQGDVDNPVYLIQYSEKEEPITAFSKLYNDAANATSGFAAVMTCSEADENCPYIPGADIRIPLRYEDPKIYDGTNLEKEKYEERSRQIAAEMLYIFSQIKRI